MSSDPTLPVNKFKDSISHIIQDILTNNDLPRKIENMMPGGSHGHRRFLYHAPSFESRRYKGCWLMFIGKDTGATQAEMEEAMQNIWYNIFIIHERPDTHRLRDAPFGKMQRYPKRSITLYGKPSDPLDILIHNIIKIAVYEAAPDTLIRYDLPPGIPAQPTITLSTTPRGLDVALADLSASLNATTPNRYSAIQTDSSSVDWVL
jgi:hypothetical protein